MLAEHIKNKILDNFKHTPTNNQKILIERLSEFIVPLNNKTILLLTGYAGTGKTTVISAFVNTLEEFKQKSVLIAPTGRAAKVISAYSKKTAFTIHKKIYIQKTATDDLGKFVLNANLTTNTIFIVDEASMISNTNDSGIFGSGRLLDDLINFVFSGKGCKLIIIGDTAQLPPVKSNLSPALNEKEIEFYGKQIETVNLSEVVRQTKKSGILFNATKIRNKITNNENGYPIIEYKNFTDVVKLNGEDLIETIATSYEKYGSENTIIVTRSNKRANKFNEGIRRTILFRDEEISNGDFLMIVKNNYFWLPENKYTNFIANGDIVRISRIGKYENFYGFRFVNVDVQFVDYPEMEISTKIILNTLSSETASLSTDQNREFFFRVAEDYEHIKDKKKRYAEIRKNPFFNALQVKFAYAVTCHKAQGGQWDSVFIDHGYITPESVDVDFLRWLYTAFTRASKKVHLINFNKEFFEIET